MELRHLRYFLAVADELHFGRAAERLHIEQSPLSRAIKDLESDLGASLFDRTSRGTRLTWAGQIFKEDAQRLLFLADQARDAVTSAAAGYRGKLRVALSDGILPHCLTTLLARSRQEEPEVEIQLYEVSLRQQLKGLNQDLYDVGLTLSDNVGNGLEAEPVWFTPLVVVVPARHPLLAFKYVTLDEVIGHPLVLFDPHSNAGLQQQIDRLLAMTNRPPHIAERVRSQELLLTLVAAGFGVGLTGEAHMASYQNPAVVTRPVADTPPVLTTYLVLPVGRHSEQLNRFTARVRDTCSDSPPGEDL